MAIRFEYRPPTVDAGLAVHAALAAADHAAAEHLLGESQKAVPVDEGVLRDSGRVVDSEAGAYVTYGLDDDGSTEAGAKHAPSNQYAVIVHEDLTANHPNGGSSKYLETPMNDTGVQDAAFALAAMELRKALGLL